MPNAEVRVGRDYGMDLTAKLALAATCVVAVYIGVRTLLIWRRTRMFPELCIGLNVLSIALGGLVLTLLMVVGSTPAEGARYYIPRVFGLLCIFVHIPASYATVWKIFRSSDRWALALVGVTTAAAVPWFLLVLTSEGVPVASSSVLLLVLRGGGMLWATLECFRYSALLRRRAALGLGDPIIAHRIWLWGLGAGFTLLAIGLDIGSWVLAGQAFINTPLGLVLAALTLAGALSIAFAFFPPVRYARRMERRYARAGEAV